MMSKKSISIILIVAIIVLLGWIRSSLFISINDVLAFIKINKVPDERPFFMGTKALFKLNYNTVYALKWVLTFVFSAMYLFISAKTLEIVFHKNSLKDLVVVYIAIYLIAFLLLATGYILGDFTNVYKLSRFLIHISHSPLPLMLVSLSAFLNQKKAEN